MLCAYTGINKKQNGLTLVSHIDAIVYQKEISDHATPQQVEIRSFADSERGYSNVSLFKADTCAGQSISTMVYVTVPKYRKNNKNSLRDEAPVTTNNTNNTYEKYLI